MILDATNLIAGRIASVAAKRALMGEDIFIINAERAIISGSRDIVVEKYDTQAKRGEPFHGPFLPKTPDRLLKRIIRGMLPYKQGKGRYALKRIKCYNGLPEGFRGKSLETIDKAHIKHLQYAHYITLGDLCNLIKQR